MRPSKEEIAQARSVIRARNKLGLSKKTWDMATVRAYQEFGAFLGVPVAARINQVNMFDCAEKLQNALNYGQGLLDDGKLPAEVKISAGHMLAMVGKTYTEMVKVIMQLATLVDEKKGQKRERNLPPGSPTTQINIRADSVKIDDGKPARNGVEAAAPASSVPL